MRAAFISALFALCVSAHAQMDTVNYSIIENSPNKSFFGLGPSYDVIVGKFNATAAAVGVSGVFVTPAFSASANFKYHFGEDLADELWGEPYARSIYEYEPSRSVNLEATYYFSNEILRHDLTVKIKRVGDIMYVIEVPCDYSKRLGIDLGFSRGVYYYNFQQTPEVVGYDANNTAVQLNNVEGRTVSTFHTYSFLKLGFSRTKLDYLRVKTQYGNRATKTISKLYANLLFSFGGTLDDVLVPYIISGGLGDPSGPYMQYSIQENGFRRIGLNLGWSVQNLNRVGVGAKLELGILPGPKSNVLNNFYFNLGMRFEVMHFFK